MSRRPFLVLVAVSLTVAVASPVLADDLEDDLRQVETRVAEVTSRIAGASHDRSVIAIGIAATEEKLDGLLVDLGRTRLELGMVKEQLTSQRGQLVAARQQLKGLYAELAAARQELDRGREAVAEWARQIYMGAGQDEVYLALAAAHLSDIQVGLGYLDEVAAETSHQVMVYEALRSLEQEQARRVQRRKAALTEEVAALDRLETELAALTTQMAAQQAAIEAELATQRSNLASLDAAIELFEGELADLETEQAGIEAAIRAAQDTGDDGGESGGGGGDGSTGFVRPVPGAITSGFGPRTHPLLGYVRMHTGLDFTALYGQGIRAAASGRVILAGWFGSYGKTVVVDHGGGVATLYAHQSDLAVGYGDQVAAGDTVGYVGSTGLSTGPHLHFEVRVNGLPVDPGPYL